MACVAAPGARSSDSVTGSLIDAGRQSPGVISGAVQQSLSCGGLTCSAEGRAGVGSGHQLSARRTPSEWTRPLPSRGVPTTIETARRVKAWHVVNPLRTPHKMGSERTCSRLEAVRSSPFRHPPYCLHAVVEGFGLEGRKRKGVGEGRLRDRRTTNSRRRSGLPNSRLLCLRSAS